MRYWNVDDIWALIDVRISCHDYAFTYFVSIKYVGYHYIKSLHNQILHTAISYWDDKIKSIKQYGQYIKGSRVDKFSQRTRKLIFQK